MKWKQVKLTAIIGFTIFIVFSIFYVVKENQIAIYLSNNAIENEAYTFIDEKELIEKFDSEKSIYDKLNIYVTNDNFLEANIKEEIETLYNNFELEIKDPTQIPLGKYVKIRYEVVKNNSQREIVISKTLDHKPEIKLFDADNEEISKDLIYTIVQGEALDDYTFIKAQFLKFGEVVEAIPLVIRNKVNNNKPGDYSVALVNTDYDFEKMLKVKVEPKKVIVVKPVTEKPNIVEQISTGKPAGPLGRVDILVNKEYHLNRDDVPQLKSIPSEYAVDNGYLAHPEAVDHFMLLVDTMEAEVGMKVLATSTYRSYYFQETLFSNYAYRDGIAAANRYSARAGQSEHQTGLALDVVQPGSSLGGFGSTAESAWVSQNAYRFGFIVRYPQGKEHITGYIYEPWHLRYLGRDLATSVFESKLTYDEYWSLYIQ